MELRPHQSEALVKIRKNPFLILNHALRSGKSITSLVYSKEGGKALVVTHPNLIKHWEKEALTVGVDPLIISWTSLSKYTADDLRSQGVKGFIIDEAHLFKNHRSKRSKDLLSLIVALQPRYTLLLTGTPFKEGRNMSLYNLLNLVGHPLAVDYSRFVRTYSDPSDLKTNKNVGNLLRAVEPYIHTYTNNNKTTEPEYIRTGLWLPKKPQSAGEWIEGFREESQHKIPMCVDLVTPLEASHVVVLTWFVETAQKLHNSFKIRGLSTTLATGLQTASERAKSLVKWKSEGGIYVGTIAANCEGLDLSEASVLIMHDLCFEETKNTQALKRADTYHEECREKWILGGSWLADITYLAFRKKVDLNPLNIGEFAKQSVEYSTLP